MGDVAERIVRGQGRSGRPGPRAAVGVPSGPRRPQHRVDRPRPVVQNVLHPPASTTLPFGVVNSGRLAPPRIHRMRVRQRDLLDQRRPRGRLRGSGTRAGTGRSGRAVGEQDLKLNADIKNTNRNE